MWLIVLLVNTGQRSTMGLRKYIAEYHPWYPPTVVAGGVRQDERQGKLLSR